jgi:hypothetical protein
MRERPSPQTTYNRLRTTHPHWPAYNVLLRRGGGLTKLREEASRLDRKKDS